MVWAHWVRRFRPHVIVVECVSNWAAWPVESILSDGWVCVQKIFCPSDLGLPIRRKRIYLAWLRRVVHFP